MREVLVECFEMYAPVFGKMIASITTPESPAKKWKRQFHETPHLQTWDCQQKGTKSFPAGFPEVIERGWVDRLFNRLPLGL